MKKRSLALLLVLAMMMSLISGCGKKYEALAQDQSGDITIMLWSGDGSYLEDIGKLDLAPEELHGQNIAAAYATAKAFNEEFPNVKINIFAKAGGPDDENGTWAQHLENFKAEHGKYPDLYASTDLVGDISKGMIADLSRFSDDPMYQSFNKPVMDMMNFNGFQAGVPQYLIPWGVYVNRSLAEDNNLDVPDPDWSIDDYTSFIRQADMKNFFGEYDVATRLLETGTKDLNYSLVNYKGTGDYVNLNSEEVKDLISYIPKWSDYAVMPQNDLGNIPVEVLDENWWWGFKFFIENKLLTLEGDPWMMGDAAHPDEAHWGRAKAADWDIYPRPSTAYQPNTVGVVLDPLVVINYAMDDGDMALSEAELQKMKIAYTFAAFWVGDTKAIKARAEQMFLDGENLKTSLNDSLPLVTGDAFKEQMDIWYSVDTHKRFADTAKMPGFAKVLDIWEKGQFWDISDKSYPFYHDFEGERRLNLYEWKNMWNPEIAGAARSDSNYVDVVKSKLYDWNQVTNERFTTATLELQNAMKKYYGYTDKDFEAQK